MQTEMMLTRGELAKASAVNRETIRYYERSGLLPEPARSEGNYCLFDVNAVERVQFVKHAQAVGFSLDEIRSLLEIKYAPDATCGEVRMMADAKVTAIEQKIRALEAMRDALLVLVEDCPGGDRPVEDCPILDSFITEPMSEQVERIQDEAYGQG